MKILIATEHLRRLPGLHDEIVGLLGERLARRGHDVTMLCDSVADETLFPSVRFVARRTFVKGDSHRLLLLHRWARQTMKRVEHDVSISFHPAIPADLVVPLNGWVHTRLTREHRHHQSGLWNLCLHLWPPVLERKIVESSLRRRSRVKHFIALSRPMLETMSSRYPGLRDKWSLIPGASPTEPAKEAGERAHRRRATRELLGFDDTHVVFLWATNRLTWHGMPYLVDAFAGACDRSASFAERARLLVAAEGQWIVHDRAVKRGCADQVCIVGRTNDFGHLLESSDVVVNPAVHSHLGRLVWEGIAFGKPVIASEHAGGTERMQTDDRRMAGRIVRPYDVTSLQSAMEEMLDDETRSAATRLADELAPHMRFEEFVQRIEASLRAVADGRTVSSSASTSVARVPVDTSDGATPLDAADEQHASTDLAAQSISASAAGEMDAAERNGLPPRAQRATRIARAVDSTPSSREAMEPPPPETSS